MNFKRSFLASSLFLFVLMSGNARIQASEPEVAVLFQTQSAGIGEEIPLTIRITGAQGNIQAPHIAVPQGVESFYTGRSSNISFINGVSSSSVEFSYVLVGRRGGKYNIQTIDVTIAGKVYHSEPLSFEVTGDTGSPSPAGSSSARAPAASSSMPARTSGQGAPPAAPQSSVQEPPAAYRPEDSNIYVVASADKTTAYPNEQILLSYSLYTRYDTRYEGFGDEPEMSGFWIEEFPPERDVRRETVRVGGKQYIRAEIRQIALFPTAPAQYEIKPGTLKASIRQEPQSNGAFDEFFNDSFFNGSGFFSRRENRILKPAPIQIKVIPFPEEGKPVNFNGAVGNFRMTASVDHETVKQNEPVTLTVKIEGEGNIETLKQPGIPELDGFKVYESDSKAELSKSGYVIGGKKTFEIVFIPTEAGQHFIPKLSFSFFNPRTRQYQTLFTDAFTLRIEASKEPPPALPSGMENEETLKKGIKKEGQDIQYIQDKFGNDGWAGAADKALGGLTLLDVLLTLLLAAGLWRAYNESVLAKDSGLRRRKMARQAALSRMGKLKKYARSDKPQDVTLFFNELDKVLTQYLSDKFNLSAFGATRSGLERELEKTLGRDHELFLEITKLYGLCEESRYGLGDVSSVMRTEALQILKQTVSVFEKVKK